MNTSFLKNFIAVAEEKSISAAARREHIAQSALSLQLKTLEDEAGCELLIRSRYGISLSDQGEVFYHYARRILGLENEMKSRVEEISSGVSGILRLGISSSCLLPVTENQLRCFGRQFGDTVYDIYERPSAEVLTALRTGTVEVGVIKSTSVPMEDMHIHYTRVEPTAVLFSNNLIKHDGDSISFSQLKDVPLCVARRSLEVIKHMCATYGYEPNIVACCEQHDTAAGFAHSCRGAAIVPLTLAWRYLEYSYEAKRSYFNTDRVKVYTKEGKRLYPQLCDAPNASAQKNKCSVMLEKGFDGYLLYPLDFDAIVPISTADARVGLNDISETTDFVFDFRSAGAQKGFKYGIGGIYLTDSLEELFSGDAVVMDDFSSDLTIANDYRAENMSMYGQHMPAIAVNRTDDNCKALTMSIPADDHYVDIINCNAPWVRKSFVPGLSKRRYLAIRIINRDIPHLAFSVGIAQINHPRLLRLEENFLDTSMLVLSCTDRPLSSLAQAFVDLFKE